MGDRWITHRTSAEILGAYLTAVRKMVKGGEVHPRQVRRSLPPLDRAEVETLADERQKLIGRMFIQ